MPNRFQRAWNAFLGRDPTQYTFKEIGVGSSFRPDRPRLTRGNERSIITSVYNRIAIDVSTIDIEHVRLNEEGKFVETIDSKLNNCLTLDANIDQTGEAFIRDVVMSMFDEGCIAIVPTDTIYKSSGSFDVEKMRTAKIIEWFPAHVKVLCYNELSGKKEEIILSKDKVAIIENPLYSIMNEPNSTLQRLIRTVNRLDLMNDQSTSGKLDLIIQLPYVIKGETRKAQAEQRRLDIEKQLTGTKYGIAYTDGTEKITQLNRSVDNQLWQQVQDLTAMLYNQLGLTQSVFDGTADESVMLNYYSRTIDPILSAISDEMQRKFLTKTARSQHQAIRYFRDPFKLVPAEKLADIADKLTRNEIASSNEMRATIGWKPVDTPEANELRNKNVSKSKDEASSDESNQPVNEESIQKLIEGM